jgi:hypothetical protein
MSRDIQLSSPSFLLRAEAFCILFVTLVAYRLLFPHHYLRVWFASPT